LTAIGGGGADLPAATEPVNTNRTQQKQKAAGNPWQPFTFLKAADLTQPFLLLKQVNADTNPNGGKPC